MKLNCSNDFYWLLNESFFLAIQYQLQVEHFCQAEIELYGLMSQSFTSSVLLYTYVLPTSQYVLLCGVKPVQSQIYVV